MISPIKISPFVRRTSIGGVAPVNTVAPAISGVNVVGQTLTVSHGTYTGVEPIVISGNWQRNGVDIVSEINDTYTLVAGDVGKSIRYRELATDLNGNTTTTYSNEYHLYGIGYMIIGSTFIIS